MNFKSLKRFATLVYRSVTVSNRIQRQDFMATHLHGGARYADPLKLNWHEFSVYSQGGEDGIIAEIFRRIGIASSTFVEVGLEDGKECNTHLLLSQGWKGLWVEGSPRCGELIRRRFAPVLQAGQLRLENRFIGPADMDGLIKGAALPEEFDLLSIDVDGIDYQLWQAVAQFRPRVVVVEYNGLIPPYVDWVPEAHEAGPCMFPGVGASLKALERLGRDKGYTLVGCGFTGSNAFWVRSDLAGNLFCPQATAEHHFEPLRVFLVEPHHVD
ncbi:MAG: hypothetical protein JWO94_2739 [Verrucomicrobiaceae bacterium]|nr:hypothetical protein [Verrucomicrobiaceae bacterium]